MKIHHFFDKKTATLTYVLFDETTKDAIVIDPVLDFDVDSGVVEDNNLKQLVNYLKEQKLNPHWCLETHAHADHLSAAHYLKNYFPTMKTGIGEKIKVVQRTFKDVFMLDDSFLPDGHQFDKLIKEGDEIIAGPINLKAISTSGHTPACMSYLGHGVVFSGDALFVEDGGTGRCDFPNGSAEELFHSIHDKLYTLPDETEVFVGHDYQPGGRELRFKTTIKESKEKNIHIKSQTTKSEYVHFRTERDKTLNPPKLLTPSLIVNIRGGELPGENEHVKFIDKTTVKN
jgi:glyoxylase-like metal-dependent hydrolase (beta-lactamase superfamily II)